MIGPCHDYRSQGSRRGAVLAVVLVLLAAVMLICGSLLRTVSLEHRKMALEERRQQVDWLAESSLARAIAQLNRSNEYTGETWRLSAEELAAREDAVVTIRVEPSQEPGEREVYVEARFGNGEQSVRRTKRIVLPTFTSGAVP